ncbi:LuxR family transcriptional regulator [Mycolicibacter senuensis]|uniref:LuxR family transcriptional regulator n=2 Tax=Mycolicibacter senuensis TaxID=386913 RepID=A0A7I9XFQ9_9MYCO|nr:LuxR family transcriptional regulator [Mycolicibacter senuensis]
MAIDDFSRLVAAVYRAVMSPADWTAVLCELQRTLDAQCALVRVDESGRTIQNASLAAEARADYEQHYRRIDYVLAAVEQSPVGVLRSGRSLIALQAKSEFHVDWLRPLEMTDGLLVRLTGGPAPQAFLAAGPRSPEPFVPLISALVPHLQQALRCQARLAAADRRAVDLANVTEALRQAVIVVTTDSRIVYANAAAEDMLRSGGGLRMRGGRLEAVAASADNALQRGIHDALAAGDSTPSGSSVLCTRPANQRPYIIEVLPAESAAGGSARRAMVMVFDPEHESDTTPALLRRHYGLTAGETEVAVMVLSGSGVKDIAERMSLSQATVKTHLQHVFDKTGTHRQADLIRLLLSLRSPRR